MKKLLFVLVVCFTFSLGSNAQSMGRTYKTALGVKVFDGAGVTLKSFVTPSNAVEVIGYFYRHGTRLTGLYEIHGNIAGAPGLKWYVGPGAHVSFYNVNNRNRYDSYAAAGIDGVLGLDLKINGAPINLSIDWQPSFEFGEYRDFLGNQGGLGIRYTF
ncbi:MAG: hypothetical protein JWQ96_853 [Segetibacter sp.]|nr:hypothetical protein [Segetibacter sp.]